MCVCVYILRLQLLLVIQSGRGMIFINKSLNILMCHCYVVPINKPRT